jgi:anti-sigma28 factor (negative regulator of flagellin synthesis)
MDIRSVAAAYGAKPVNSVAKSEKKAAPEQTAVAPSEHLELSEASISMQKVKEAIDATPDIRLKAVEEIRNKIKFNGYPLESTFYKAMEKMVSEKLLT